jgi:hypothetical protein
VQGKSSKKVGLCSQLAATGTCPLSARAWWGFSNGPEQEEQGLGSMPAKVRSFDVDFQLETALDFGTF